MIQASAIPSAQRPNHTKSTVREFRPRSGLLAAAIGSKHHVTLTLPGGRSQQVYLTVQDKDAFPHATGKLVCLHASCAGKSWANADEMRKAHPSSVDMEKRGEAHVFALWSDSPVNPHAEPAGDCPACLGEKGKPPKVCVTHAGGVCGLLSSGDV